MLSAFCNAKSALCSLYSPPPPPPVFSLLYSNLLTLFRSSFWSLFVIFCYLSMGDFKPHSLSTLGAWELEVLFCWHPQPFWLLLWVVPLFLTDRLFFHLILPLCGHPPPQKLQLFNGRAIQSSLQIYHQEDQSPSRKIGTFQLLMANSPRFLQIIQTIILLPLFYCLGLPPCILPKGVWSLANSIPCMWLPLV